MRAEPEPIPPAKVQVHLTLPLIFLFFLSVPVGWILALVQVLKGSDDPAQQRWTRALVALVVVDSLAALGAFAFYERRQELLGPSMRLSVEQRLQVGLEFEPGGTALSGVTPASPAEEAGLRRGDRIVSIDGTAIEGLLDLYVSLGQGEPGVARRLGVERDGSAQDLSVVPRAAPAKEGKGLFHRVEMDADWGLAGLLRPFLPALLVGLGAWAWARARGRPAAGVWGGLFAAVALSLAGGFGLLRLLGPSAGNVLLSLIFQHLLLGAAALRLLRGDAASAFAGVLPAGPVVRQGIFYLLCGLPRVALVVLAAQVLLGPGAAPASDPLSLLAQADLGPLGTLLFVLPVVVLAPIGEELLFRGWLLPQLGRQMGPGLALLLSSAVFSLLHPHYSLQILVVFFLGMILGWARLKSGGLKAPILLHMGINGVSTLFMLS